MIVLDLNCLLGYKQYSKILSDQIRGFGSINAKTVKNEFSYFLRPHLEVLLKTLFVNKKREIDVAVWATQNREETVDQTFEFLRSFRYR